MQQIIRCSNAVLTGLCFSRNCSSPANNWKAALYVQHGCPCHLLNLKHRCIAIKQHASVQQTGRTDLEKLARFCSTLAMSVSVRDVCSSGYSWVRLNNDGDMTAGQRKRRKREPLIRRSAMSSLPLSAQRTRQDAKTSFSSRGKALANTEHLRFSISTELKSKQTQLSSYFKNHRIIPFKVADTDKNN